MKHNTDTGAAQCDRLAIYTDVASSYATVDTLTLPVRAGATPPNHHTQYGRQYVLACVVSGDMDTDAAILQAVRDADAAGELDFLLEDVA